MNSLFLTDLYPERQLADAAGTSPRLESVKFHVFCHSLSGNLEILPKQRETTGNFICLSSEFPDCNKTGFALFATKTRGENIFSI